MIEEIKSGLMSIYGSMHFDAYVIVFFFGVLIGGFLSLLWALQDRIFGETLPTSHRQSGEVKLE